MMMLTHNFAAMMTNVSLVFYRRLTKRAAGEIGMHRLELVYCVRNLNHFDLQILEKARAVYITLNRSSRSLSMDW